MNKSTFLPLMFMFIAFYTNAHAGDFSSYCKPGNNVNKFDFNHFLFDIGGKPGSRAGLNNKTSMACTGAETCFDIVSELRPISDGGFVCTSSCNDMNVSEAGDCDPNGASVWFKVVTDDNSTSLVIDINSPFSSLVSVFKGNSCNSLELVPLLPPCIGNKTFKVSSNANASYWIKVEAANGLNLGAFDMCVSSFYNSFDCYSADITQISRPSYPNENPEGPFYPGEEVEFCFEIQFYVSAPPPPNGNNCQWIQGIIPSLSDAWDYEGSNLSAQGPVGSWFWLDEDNVDYNVNSNIYSIKTVDGRKYMEYGGQNAGMPDGTTLPGGWWVVSNAASSSCTNDGDPDNMWGFPSSCNATIIFDFCVDLKVKDWSELQDCENQKLDITLAVMADGETGCWSDISCSLSSPLYFETAINCAPNPIEIQLADATICEGGCIDIEPKISGGSGVYTAISWSDGSQAALRKLCPEVTTTYHLTITDSNGNTASASILITVVPTPAGALLPNVVSFCTKMVNDTQPSVSAYMYKGKPPYIFNWQLPNGLVGQLDSINYKGDTYDIDEAATPGTGFPKQICVTVIDQNGCADVLCSTIKYNGICKDSCYVIVYDTIRTSLVDTNFVNVEALLIILNVTIGSNETAINTITVYPNPANTHIYLDMGDQNLLKNYEFEILNEAGQTILLNAIQEKLYFLDLSKWGGKGIYFVRIKNSDGTIVETRKIVLI